MIWMMNCYSTSDPSTTNSTDSNRILKTLCPYKPRNFITDRDTFGRYTFFCNFLFSVSLYQIIYLI